jgi:hypothetical protein
LDDVHWAEPTLSDLIAHLAEGDDAPLLLVVTGRPTLRERHPGLAEHVAAELIDLRPLDEAGAGSIIDDFLGAGGMRHDATRGFSAGHAGARDFAAALPRLVEGCRAVTEFAAEQGVRTMVENHGFFCQDSERVERLVNGVCHPNFGLLVDVGNFLCADDDPGMALGRLMPYAFHIHFKDFHVKPGALPNPGSGWFLSRGGNYLRGAIVGHGDVSVPQCLHFTLPPCASYAISIPHDGHMKLRASAPFLLIFTPLYAC